MISRLLPGLLIALIANCAYADQFVNGGFETGTSSGWTTGQGYRGAVSNTGLSPADLLPGGSLYAGTATRSAVIATGYVDPLLGALLGSTVYNGNYAYRAEDTSIGGNASAVSQFVHNYTDTNIFFVWKAVLENGGHSATQSAEMVINLFDNTTNTLVLSRVYNAGAGGGGVDARFASSGDLFYTPQWQVEQLTIDGALSGHDFTLSLLAADCQPTGHVGYAYLDGFGATVPPNNVPEPMTISLLGIGAALFGFSRRKKSLR